MVLRMAGLLSVIVLLTSTQAFSQDVIYTMEGEKQEARVQVVGPETITYQRYQDSTGVKRQIPLSEVYMVRYENGQEEFFTDQTEATDSANAQQGTAPDSSTKESKATTAEGKPLRMLSEEEKCARGRADARQYHKKVVPHLLYGFLLGPLATIGAALSDPTPASGKSTVVQSENQALFDDPVYLSCYQKEARGDNVSATIIGPITVGILLFFN
jgi:hypothetical protein